MILDETRWSDREAKFSLATAFQPCLDCALVKAWKSGTSGHLPNFRSITQGLLYGRAPNETTNRIDTRLQSGPDYLAERIYTAFVYSWFPFMVSHSPYYALSICSYALSPHPLILSPQPETNLHGRHANLPSVEQETSTALPITLPTSRPASSSLRVAKSTPRRPLMKVLLPSVATCAAVANLLFHFCQG